MVDAKEGNKQEVGARSTDERRDNRLHKISVGQQFLKNNVSNLLILNYALQSAGSLALSKRKFAVVHCRDGRHYFGYQYLVANLMFDRLSK